MKGKHLKEFKDLGRKEKETVKFKSVQSSPLKKFNCSKFKYIILK